MPTQNLAPRQPLHPLVDVALPQADDICQNTCQYGYLSAIVNAGRTQAALTSHKGAAQSTLPAIKWSRGCRALNSPFWHFALPLSWLAALKKQPTKSSTRTSQRLLPQSQPTPANTSNLIGRVSLALMAAPALFLSAMIPLTQEGSAC